MNMACIKRNAEVIVQECYMVEEKIFLKTCCGFELQYIGKYSFNQVLQKIRIGKTNWIGIDLSETYFALPDDIAAYQLR